MPDPQQVSVAVAVVRDDAGRILLTWNDKWGAFTLPQTKPDPTPPAEPPKAAALRAAAEVLGRPVRAVGDVVHVHVLARSSRTGELKSYEYDVLKAEPHPAWAGPPVFRTGYAWAAPADLLDGTELAPLSDTVGPLVKELRGQGWM